MGKKKLISPGEAEKITGLSISTIRRLCRDGVITAKEDGRHWLIDKSGLHVAAADGKLPVPRKRRGRDHRLQPDWSRYATGNGVTIEEAYSRAIKAQLILDGIDGALARTKLASIQRSVEMIMGAKAE